MAIGLQHLITLDGTFDITITGFEIPEINLIIGEGKGNKSDPDDEVAITATAQVITQPGDFRLLAVC